MDMPVTSVTKEAGTVGRSAAAVFVITNEMIRRSGATSIPEALRMAPGLDVAHINSNMWAISSRGFNGPYADKLLVLIDGRTVYSPVSTGVNWDIQDVLLEDVDRIEVIRGPGGTLWGANAVNGVINIITKQSSDTQGAYISAGGGTVERSNEAVRYGGRIGEDGYYRIYGKYFDRSPFFDPNMPANDGWNQGRWGFRTDFNLDRDKSNTLTIQGDHYVGTSGSDSARTIIDPPSSQLLEGSIRNNGENVLARYHHVTDEDSDWTLQSYFDNFENDSNILNTERARTFDVNLQYRFRLTERQMITCGAGYRYIQMDCPSLEPFTESILPVEQNYNKVSQFVQDDIALAPDELDFILGCKLEQNSYTGLEYQPTARLLWTPDHTHTLWGAVSRAVRTPCEVSRSLFITEPLGPDMPLLRVLGNQDYGSETLIAYEVGYRTQATERFSYDIATFYNVYNQLEEVVPVSGPKLEQLPLPPHMILPMTFTNLGNADSYGLELATNWTVSERWRLSAEYTFLRLFVHDGQGGPTSNGNSPIHQFYLRSSWNLGNDLDFDLIVRYVDCLTDLDVPSYMTMDLRLAWRPRKRLELAVVGQNLLQPYHYEFGKTADNLNCEITEVPRGVYGTVTLRY